MDLTTKILSAVLLALLGCGSMAAQIEFDPANPPDPTPTYKVTVTATPAGMAYASGTGLYSNGTSVYISASSSDYDYELKYWEQDGKRIDMSEGFYYTVEEANVAFNAVFGLKDFNPGSPDDPNVNYEFPLTFEAVPAEACSFNYGSGTRFLPQSWVYISAYASQGFDFIGWYDGNTLVSTSLEFYYEMPDGAAKLQARFEYNPYSPDDPASSGDQPGVSNVSRGDVNGDNVVDVSDATTVINWFLSTDEYKLKYDMNLDDAVDVSDSTNIINQYLK